MRGRNASLVGQFRFQATFRTWLTSIALNEIRQNGRIGINARLVLDGGKRIESTASERGESPFELYEREEAAQRLRNAIGTLPLKYRLVIEVFDLNERSVSESQAALRIPIGTAKTQLFRARRRLGRLLTEMTKRPVKARTEKVLA